MQNINLSSLVFREEVKDAHCKDVRDIVSSTGFFYKDEIDIAVELVDAHLEKGIASGYHFLFAEYEGRVIGYTCFGPIACTKASYDLFWIAVHNDFRSLGLGKILMEKSEEKIKDLGGKRIYIETSGRDQYASTRAFYLRYGCKEEAVLKDFYAPGDDKFIFLTVLE